MRRDRNKQPDEIIMVKGKQQVNKEEVRLGLQTESRLGLQTESNSGR